MNRVRCLQGKRAWCGLCVMLLANYAGCGKVPTWNELTNQQQQTQQSQQSTVIQSPPMEQAVPAVVKTPEPPAKPDAETVIAEFKRLQPSRVDDSAIAKLASLEEGVELVTEIDATGGAVSNEGLSALPKLTGLKVLRLEGTKVSDAGCQAIGQLPGLEELTLTGGNISDVGVEFLSDLTQLKILRLAQTRLTLHGWEIIGQLPQLNSIFIDGSSLDDESTEALCHAKTLRKVHLGHTMITDEALKYFGKLDDLVWFDVADCPVDGHLLGSLNKGKNKSKLIHLGVYGTRLDNRGVNAIAGMSSLESLWVGKLQGMTDAHFAKLVNGKKGLRVIHLGSNRGLTNDALGSLTPLKELEYIEIGENPGINDQGLIHLTKLKKLKTLAHGGSGVTNVGIEMLRKSIPELNRGNEPANTKWNE